MGVPIVVFKKMTLEANIVIVENCFYTDVDDLDVKGYVLDYYPELKDISINEDYDIVHKRISEIVKKDYDLYNKRIDDEVERYNRLWSKYNDDYLKALSSYLNTEWPDNIKTINVDVGLIPVFPRYLDTYGFSISTNISDKDLIKSCAHEICHFLWFKKWSELHPDSDKEEWESPYIPWKYSEMVVDPIMNSKEIQDVFNGLFKEKTYDIFYTIKDGDTLVMDRLREIYNSKKSIEEKIEEGYSFIEEILKNDKKKLTM